MLNDVQFQSTHPSGVRLTLDPRDVRLTLFQSTHPSGVRPNNVQLKTHFLVDFNPRTPVGCDVRAFQDRCGFHQFQSTHPSGVRPPSYTAASAYSRYFNPRTPVGCDLHIPGHGTFSYPISIHAPQWGATHALQSGRRLAAISIHAPQWGATLDSHMVTALLSIFQSTHPSGVRLREWA